MRQLNVTSLDATSDNSTSNDREFGSVDVECSSIRASRTESTGPAPIASSSNSVAMPLVTAASDPAGATIRENDSLTSVTASPNNGILTDAVL